MNKTIYLVIFILSLYNCKQVEKKNLPNKAADTLENTVEIKDEITLKNSETKNQKKCVTDIFLEGAIPTFNYKSIYKQNYSSNTFLLDTLFKNFNALHIKAVKNNNRNYTEFSQKHTPSANIKTSKIKENTFGFFIGLDSINIKDNKTNVLEYAQINFPTKYYKNTNKDLFKIKKDSSLIDIGITKQEFALIFEKDTKKLCDTVFVGNETDESFYIFKEGKLNKIIFNFYTP
ncbi:MAG: hypothetical protein HRT67_02370 [Flavobacteriaceae bacterium]|nr:hypothetical protein [Flavobacteriaceae bacterium]